MDALDEYVLDEESFDADLDRLVDTLNAKSDEQYNLKTSRKRKRP